MWDLYASLSTTKYNVNFLFLEGEGSAGQPSICQNGGTYKTIQGTCECEPDYTGANCETG